MGWLQGAVACVCAHFLLGRRGLLRHPTLYCSRTRVLLWWKAGARWARGTCPRCGAEVDAAFLLGEVAGLVAGAVWGWRALVPFLVSWVVILAVVDLRSRLVPNEAVLCLGAMGLIRSLVGPWPLIGGLAGAGAAIFLLGTAACLTRGGLGWGDVKLAAALGCWLGWPATFTMLVVSILAAGAVAGVLLVSGRARRGHSVAMVPYLVLGTVIALLGRGVT